MFNIELNNAEDTKGKDWPNLKICAINSIIFQVTYSAATKWKALSVISLTHTYAKS